MLADRLSPRRLLPWLVVLALVMLGSPTVWAACTAGNPNSNLIETTPTSDFIIHGDGTVTHTKTGLMWDQCAWGQSSANCATGSASTHTWSQALTVSVTANTSSYKGYNDWRLPNAKELQSIVESCGSTPAINQQVFPAAPASAFWSASSYAPYPAGAWIVNFNAGYVYAVAKTGDVVVRLVRGGQSFDTFDLLSGRVTVSKTLTGAAAASVPAGTSFPITLTCGATTLGPLNATTATPAVFTNVPPGDCTVSEGTLPTIAGVTWGATSYNPANPITVTAGANTAVTVTNTANVTTYAVTATASPVAGGTVSCTANPVDHGSSASCTATPATGYGFSGWSGDCTGTGVCSFINVTSAKSVTASFTLNSYAITATASPVAGGTVSCTPNPVDHGSSASCTVTPATGYGFGGYSGDCTGATCTLSNVTGTRNVTALFTRNNYTITVTVFPVGSGVVTCTPNPVDHGSSASCTVTPATGYGFGGYSGDCTGATCTLSNVTANKAVTASFSQNSYTVTATAGAGGSISPASQTVNHGATTTFTVTPDAGYTAAVSGCGGSLVGTTYTTGAITGACAVTASFSQAPSNTYPITITPAPGGTVSCTPNPVPQGSNATCTASPAAGYTFSGWSGDCTGTGACSFTNVTSAKRVTASFAAAAQKTYTGPTATGTGNATATVSGGGETCGFSDARFVPLSSVATAPPTGYSFPQGLFKFTLTQCTVGSTVTLSIRYPALLPDGTSYWKYGPTTAQAEHWYPLAQAVINGATVTFNLTDGGLGDNDLKADGTISDPSGPAVLAADIPTLSEWAMLILLSVLLGIGGWTLRRRAVF